MPAPGHASLDSIDLLKDLRAALITFAEEAGVALGEADSDIGRHQQWLANQAPYWQGQVKKTQEQLAQAKEAFRKKILYKDAAGRPQSAVDEKKIVTALQRKLEEAEARLKNVERWRRQLDQEAMNYRGAAQTIGRAVEYDVPRAIALLDRMADALDKYLNVAAPSMEGAAAAGDGGETVAAGEASMARPVEEEPQANADGEPSTRKVSAEEAEEKERQP